MINNNRAVSEIVSSVLLIIISVVLVSIVLFYVVNYSGKSLSLSPQECISMQSNPPITFDSACFNSLNNNVELKLSRGIDSFVISSLKSSIIYDSKTSLWSCDNSCGSCNILESGSSKFYYIYSEEKPFGLELVINDCAKVVVKKIGDC